MQKVKYRGLLRENIKVYEINSKAVLDFTEIFENIPVSEVLLIIEPRVKSEMITLEVKYLNSETYEEIGFEQYFFLSDSPAFLKLENTLARVTIKGKCKVTVRWFLTR